LRLDQGVPAQLAPMKRGGEFEDLNCVTVLFASDACALITTRWWSTVGHSELKR
jgi:hypothetical protein